MVDCEIYSSANHTDWDSFVRESRSPLFIFERKFLEYHANRYTDHSFVFKKNNKTLAVLPANKENNSIISHGGITYGGLVLKKKLSTEIIIEIMESLICLLKELKINDFVYKAPPYVFHSQPSDEPLYLLKRYGAELFRRDLSSLIFLKDRLPYSQIRKRQIKKAQKSEIIIRSSDDFQSFHNLLCNSLAKHKTKPAHSVKELVYLKSVFPLNIELKIAEKDERVLAGVLLFLFNNVVHTQYISVSDDGGAVGALDYLIDNIISSFETKNFKYFNFGISTEDSGSFLNSGLIRQKEGFGGRGMCVDFYRLNIND